MTRKNARIAKELLRLAKGMVAGGLDFGEETVNDPRRDQLNYLKAEIAEGRSRIDGTVHSFIETIVETIDRTFEWDSDVGEIIVTHHEFSVYPNVVYIRYHLAPLKQENDAVAMPFVVEVQKRDLLSDLKPLLPSMKQDKVVADGTYTLKLQGCTLADEGPGWSSVKPGDPSMDGKALCGKLKDALVNWEKTKMGPALKQCILEFFDGLEKMVDEELGK